ncbi:hypothetical protein FQA39_LY13188 [Lamprigera yunnana]|nr:hypothetical protein FQA39_LY13188 [Lamprigera yunnana]
MRSSTNLKPEDCGWTVINNRYHHYWYNGPQSPSFEDISSTIQDLNKDDDEADDIMENGDHTDDFTSSGDESEEN